MNDQRHLTEPAIKRMTTEIFALLQRVNVETKFGAFFNYSGHTNQIDIHVTKSKEEYDVYIVDRMTMYLTPYSIPKDEEYKSDIKAIEGKLEKIITNLKKILDKYSEETPKIDLLD